MSYSTATTRAKSSRKPGKPAPAAKPRPKAPAIRKYVSQVTGRVAGQRVAKGDVLELTEKQAKYEQVLPADTAKGATTK